MPVKQAVFDRKPVTKGSGRLKTLGLSGLFLISFFLTPGCQPNPSILNSGPSNKSAAAANTPERPKDTYESALGGVQRSGFDYIFVIRRKDGGKFEKEDKVFVRENSPAATNQFVLTDEERVVIAGSNYPFPEESLEILRKVFDVEDLSPKKAENAGQAENAGGNANGSTNGSTNGNTNDKSNTGSNK